MTERRLPPQGDEIKKDLAEFGLGIDLDSAYDPTGQVRDAMSTLVNSLDHDANGILFSGFNAAESDPVNETEIHAAPIEGVGNRPPEREDPISYALEAKYVDGTPAIAMYDSTKLTEVYEVGTYATPEDPREALLGVAYVERPS